MVGIPGRIVRKRGYNGVLEHGKLPEPEAHQIQHLARRLAELEKQVRALAAEKIAAGRK